MDTGDDGTGQEASRCHVAFRTNFPTSSQTTYILSLDVTLNPSLLSAATKLLLTFQLA